MKCLLCKKEIDAGFGIRVNEDGSCACSMECYERREKIKEHFFEHIMKDNVKFAEWLGMPVEWIWTL
jgi:hypothetical protein